MDDLDPVMFHPISQFPTSEVGIGCCTIEKHHVRTGHCYVNAENRAWWVPSADSFEANSPQKKTPRGTRNSCYPLSGNSVTLRNPYTLRRAAALDRF